MKTNEYLNNKTFYQPYSINNTFKLLKNLSIQANARSAPKSISLQSTNYAAYNLNLAVSKDVFNKKVKIILKVNEVFNSHRHDDYDFINKYNLENTSVGDTSRHTYLTFKYDFGFGKKINMNCNRKQRD